MVVHACHPNTGKEEAERFLVSLGYTVSPHYKMFRARGCVLSLPSMNKVLGTISSIEGDAFEGSKQTHIDKSKRSRYKDQRCFTGSDNEGHRGIVRETYSRLCTPAVSWAWHGHLSPESLRFPVLCCGAQGTRKVLILVAAAASPGSPHGRHSLRRLPLFLAGAEGGCGGLHTSLFVLLRAGPEDGCGGTDHPGCWAKAGGWQA